MKKPTAIALTLLLTSVGMSLAEAPHAALAGNAVIADQDGLGLQTVTDLASVVGGEQNHVCSGHMAAMAQAIIDAGLTFGDPGVVAVGFYLLATAVCI